MCVDTCSLALLRTDHPERATGNRRSPTSSLLCMSPIQGAHVTRRLRDEIVPVDQLPVLAVDPARRAPRAAPTPLSRRSGSSSATTSPSTRYWSRSPSPTTPSSTSTPTSSNSSPGESARHSESRPPPAGTDLRGTPDGMVLKPAGCHSFAPRQCRTNRCAGSVSLSRQYGNDAPAVNLVGAFLARDLDHASSQRPVEIQHGCVVPTNH